jgi:uncharacterized protein
MRAPSDLPRRVPRPSGRGRTLLVVVAIGLFLLITSLRGIAGFYTDFLWFDSLGQASVWRGVLGARIALAVIFTLVFFLLLWANLLIADRLAPPFRPRGPEEEFIERYQELVGGRTALIRVAVAGVLALIAGIGVSSEWQSWLLFVHGGDFGIADPQFDTDIGFYVFRLPFLSFLVGWLFAAVLIVFVVTAVAHYLNGGIRMATSAERVSPQVKAHLSVLLALLALVKAAGYWFQRYELTVSSRGAIDGAAYTDVNAQLPAIYLLMLISLASVVLFIVNIWRRGWVLPAVGVGLWALVAVVAGGIYPQFVQRFQVQPSELAREEPYIERNIEATRAAHGLDEVEVVPFTPSNGDDVTLEDNLPTIRNIRLWDPAPVISGKTFQQLQGIRDYYRFSDIDVDRYVIDGELTQVLVSARDLDPSRVPQQSWEGRHVAYTHGYGMALAPASGATGGSREPDFQMRDVPVDNRTDIPFDQTQVYFGEGLGGYVIVGAERDEIDFHDGESTLPTRYEGEDGIGVGSYLRRAAFALRFGDINPLISNLVSGDSRLIMLRDVRERAQALAPFLHFDHDPYPVVIEGRLQFVIDAYTTTDRYPYSQRAETSDLMPDSGLNHSFNYVRNSVKTVVDAYDGTVTFYVIEPEPVIDAYRTAFPSLFTDGDEMPEELVEHLRYPEDMFRAQTNLWGRYHLSEPSAFFDRDDAWVIAQDPGTAGAGAPTQEVDEQGEPVGAPRAARMAPYYQLLQLPEQEEAEFALLRPFAPFSEDDQRQQLTAFMAARADGENYGKLIVYEMPRRDLPDGPGIAGASIQANNEVSRIVTLLSGGGTEVLFGNLLLVPIDGALLYVQPLYVEPEAAARQIPRLEFVIAVLGERVVIENTLGEALEVLFDQEVDTGETAPIDPIEIPPPGEEDIDDPESPPTTDPGDPEDPAEDPEDDPLDEPLEGTVAEQIATLLAQAEQLFADADEALQEGGAAALAEYQELTEQAQERLEQAADLIEELLDDEGSNGGGDDGGASDGDGGNGGTTTTENETTPA